MKVLQLTAHYFPNLGGVETHLTDLVGGLIKKNNEVFVLTYRPLSVKSKWRMFEKKPALTIFRIPWIAGFFNKFANYPWLEFLYLFPGLFVTLPIILLVFRPQVIHAHGLVAGLVGTLWGKVFNIRTIVSTHSIYNFPSSGIYRTFAKLVYGSANKVLCLSNQSVEEIKALGVDSRKVGRFTYWVDLEKFKPVPKAKEKLGWTKKFVVLFVGRLVPEKGIPELLNAAKFFKPGISLKIAGSGPMEPEVKQYYIGRISQDDLPTYYSAADVLIVPSTHEEGFGRVILESLACGTPVIGANRGAIPEAMDNTVGKLITITPQKIAETVNRQNFPKNTRKFALSRYSSKNIKLIIDSYL